MEENIYIQIVNGAPVNHPSLESNLINAFGSVPTGWAPFTRIQFADSGITLQGPYQKYVCTYVLSSDGITWTDSFSAVEMDDDEKLIVQNNYLNVWNRRQFLGNFSAWTFDASLCQMVPPTPRPTDAPSGQQYRWQGSTNSWQIAPTTPPNDGQLYTWDYTTWAWAVVQPTPTPA
jgi:hypothetical protein